MICQDLVHLILPGGNDPHDILLVTYCISISLQLPYFIHQDSEVVPRDLWCSSILLIGTKSLARSCSQIQVYRVHWSSCCIVPAPRGCGCCHAGQHVIKIRRLIVARIPTREVRPSQARLSLSYNFNSYKANSLSFVNRPLQSPVLPSRT